MIERLERTVEDLDTTDERPLPSFPLDPLDMVENTAEIQRPTIPDVRPPAPAHEPSPSMLPVVMPMDYANGDAPTATALPAPAVPAAALPPAKPPILSLVALRRAKARAEDAPANVRCHAALALAVALAKANRPEDALLEALDALARAREAQEPRAEEACLAFLAKLARTMGMNAAAEELLAGGTASPGRR
jgi:hypothetical protein